jgi:hypothetical protein
VPLISRRRGWHAFGFGSGDWGRRAGSGMPRREDSQTREGCRRRDPKTEAAVGARARACALRIGCPHSRLGTTGPCCFGGLSAGMRGDVQIPRVRRAGTEWQNVGLSRGRGEAGGFGRREPVSAVLISKNWICVRTGLAQPASCERQSDRSQGCRTGRNCGNGLSLGRVADG